MSDVTIPRFGEIAGRLAENGYDVLPIHWGRKHPCAGEGWQNYQFTSKDLETFRFAGVGIKCGRTVGADIDVLDAELAQRIEKLAEEMLGAAPRRIGQAPKVLRLYQAEKPFSKIATSGYRLPGDDLEQKPHRVEVLARGQQLVAYNEHEKTHKPYLWNGEGEPLSIAFEQLTVVTEQQARAFINAAEQILAECGKRVGRLTEADTSNHHPNSSYTLSDGQRAADPTLLRSALESIPNPDAEYDDWCRVLHAVKGALGDDGLADFVRWSAKSAKHDVRKSGRDFRLAKPHSLGAGTIFYLAMRHGWRDPRKAQAARARRTDSEPPPSEEIPIEAYALEEDIVAAESQQALDAQRAVIRLEAGQLHAYADAAERLIAGDTYVRAQKLVRIGTAIELSKAARKLIERAPEQRVIVAVNAEFLRRRLNTRAEFQKFSRQRHQWEPIDCPDDLAKNILLAGDWQHFRPLEAIATAPFVRADLTVCETPGYDEASHVYYAPNAEYPPLPARPNKDDADAALERLIEPFSEFPFASDAAKAAFLAHILTAVARHAIDTRPVVIYSAPQTGTGKTLLSRMANFIADGVPPAVRAYADDAEETRKVLLSALLAGDSALCFDNVPSGSKVRSPTLCAFATADVYQDRKLGVSAAPALVNLCAVSLSGNNITTVGDLGRRSTVPRLDANAESARGRKFKIPNLKSYVREHRPRLLIDALIVIRAHALSGADSGLPALESFEAWSRIARDPIAWLGHGDAVASQERETEDDVDPLREAFRALAAWPGFRPPSQFAAREIAKECAQFGGESLRAAIETAGCTDATSALKVGYWLREHRDRVAGAFKLTSLGHTDGAARWKFLEKK